MTRKNDKIRAIEMRKKGMSYSEIKSSLGVGKSTLSNWLSSMPLTKEQVHALQGGNSQKIERYRETVRIKKQLRLKGVFEKACSDIGTLSERDLLLAGLSLYWGEGTKAQPALVALTNTNPGMLQFFIKWLRLFDIEKSKIRVRLHLYSDMDIKKCTNYWSKTLDIPLAQFRKPYIKKTDSFAVNYRNIFKMGTCSVTYGSAPLYEYIMMCIRVLQESTIRP